jgi:DNA N-6-adenine-methyltransferase (Dam).
MTAGRKVISTKKDWGTPQKYVDAVKEVFGGVIYLDPCSSSFSIVKAKVEYKLPDSDGLLESWNFPTIYVNPPYGNDKERRTKI